MSNYFRLVLINLKTFFNIDKVLNAKNNEELKKGILKVLLVVALIGYFGYFIYDFSNQMLEGLKVLDIEYVLLAIFFCFSSSFIIFSNINKINGILFNYKDYDILMSLPIKKSTIILSKLTTLYLSNLLYVLVLMIPSLIAYVRVASVNFVFYPVFILTLLLIPLIPLIISTILGTIITTITSKFRLKTLVNLIITLLFMFVIMFFSYKMENLSNVDIANLGTSITSKFNQIYPLTRSYINIIKDNDIKSLLIFIVVPIVLFYIFIKVINKFYIKINNNLSRSYKVKNYKLRVKKESSSLKALYKKELKRFLSSPIYLLNSGIGSILLVISVICLVFVGKGKIDEFIGIEGLSTMFMTTGPIIMGIFCALSCTTHSAISLEGKNLWIMKSIPVSPMTIYISKILVNLTILVPSILISAVALSIYLKTSFVTFIFLLITPIIYGIFISLVGLILNLSFPNFNYTNEVRVVKQSLPAFASLLLGFIVGLIPLNIKYTISSNLFVFIVTMVIFVINIFLYIYLDKVWTKKFITLS